MELEFLHLLQASNSYEKYADLEDIKNIGVQEVGWASRQRWKNDSTNRWSNWSWDSCNRGCRRCRNSWEPVMHSDENSVVYFAKSLTNWNLALLRPSTRCESETLMVNRGMEKCEWLSRCSCQRFRRTGRRSMGKPVLVIIWLPLLFRIMFLLFPSTSTCTTCAAHEMGVESNFENSRSRVGLVGSTKSSPFSYHRCLFSLSVVSSIPLVGKRGRKSTNWTCFTGTFGRRLTSHAQGRRKT